MGNEIGKKYEMSEEPIGSGGLASLWKIYSAKDRISGADVSVHVFKKEELKDIDKATREQVLDILRRDVKVLSSMAHPSVVRHIESFEENRSIMAFVTERLSCSLADALGDQPRNLNSKAAASARRRFEPYEVARGLFGIVEGLQFVHAIQRRLHLNLAPESIFVAPNGQWKIGGFGFSVSLPTDGEDRTPCPHFQSGARGGFDGHWRLHPVMAFSSPEATAPAGSNIVCFASDLFAIGCLMQQLFRDPPERRLIDAEPMPQAHQAFCSTLDLPGRIDVSGVPPDTRHIVTSLLRVDPDARPGHGVITSNSLFHSTEVTVLKSIDGLSHRNAAEAATFLTGIRPAVAGFPLRLQRDAIVEPILDAAGKDETGRLWVFALPIVTDVCERLSRKEIIATLQQKFRPAMEAAQPEALGALVEAMPLFLEKMEVTFFRSDVVPMVCRALQAETAPNVQQTALKAVSEEAFHSAIDGKTREEALLPRVCWLIVKSAVLSIRVNALMCLAKTFRFYPVQAVLEKVLPTLKFASENDQTVAVQLCVLGCYEAVSKKLEVVQPVATQILPACTPILACQDLNSKQFEMVVAKVYGMLDAVVADRRKSFVDAGVTGGTQVAAGNGKHPVKSKPTGNARGMGEPSHPSMGGWVEGPPPTPPPKPQKVTMGSTASALPGSAADLGGPPTYAPPLPPKVQAKQAPTAGRTSLEDIFSSLPPPTNPAPSGTSSLSPTPPSSSSNAANSSAMLEMFGDMKITPTQSEPRHTAIPSPLASHSGMANVSGGVGGSGFASGAGVAKGAASAATSDLSWMNSTFGGLSGFGGTAPPGGNSGGTQGGLSLRSPMLNQANSPQKMLGGDMGAYFGMSPSQAGSTRAPQPTPVVPSMPMTFPSNFGSSMAGAGNMLGNGGGVGKMYTPAVQSVNTATTGSGGASFPAGFSGLGAGGGGGGSLQDQLAKTQSEIAQLTQQLTMGKTRGVDGSGSTDLSSGITTGVIGNNLGAFSGSSGMVGRIDKGNGSFRNAGMGGGASGMGFGGGGGNTSDPFAFLGQAEEGMQGKQGTQGQSLGQLGAWQGQTTGQGHLQGQTSAFEFMK